MRERGGGEDGGEEIWRHLSLPLQSETAAGRGRGKGEGETGVKDTRNASKLEAGSKQVGWATETEPEKKLWTILPYEEDGASAASRAL